MNKSKDSMSVKPFH